jgi:hypothetical protein
MKNHILKHYHMLGKCRGSSLKIGFCTTECYSASQKNDCDILPVAKSTAVVKLFHHCAPLNPIWGEHFVAGLFELPLHICMGRA